MTNLFNGNKLLEKAGNSIINTSGKSLIRAAMNRLASALAKTFKRTIDVIFSNTSKTEFESFFPESHIPDDEMHDDNKKNGIDLSSSNNYKSSSFSFRNTNLQKKVEDLYFYMNLMTIIVTILVVLSFLNCLILVYSSKFLKNEKPTDEFSSTKLIPKQDL
jgi:sugar-specific transcriptional regulator TrmB